MCCFFMFLFLDSRSKSRKQSKKRKKEKQPKKVIVYCTFVFSNLFKSLTENYVLQLVLFFAEPEREEREAS